MRNVTTASLLLDDDDDDLPVQVKGCDLRVVSLEVREVEVIRKRLRVAREPVAQLRVE